MTIEITLSQALIQQQLDETTNRLERAREIIDQLKAERRLKFNSLYRLTITNMNRCNSRDVYFYNEKDMTVYMQKLQEADKILRAEDDNMPILLFRIREIEFDEGIGKEKID